MTNSSHYRILYPNPFPKNSADAANYLNTLEKDEKTLSQFLQQPHVGEVFIRLASLEASDHQDPSSPGDPEAISRLMDPLAFQGSTLVHAARQVATHSMLKNTWDKLQEEIRIQSETLQDKILLTLFGQDNEQPALLKFPLPTSWPRNIHQLLNVVKNPAKAMNFYPLVQSLEAGTVAHQALRLESNDGDWFLLPEGEDTWRIEVRELKEQVPSTILEVTTRDGRRESINPTTPGKLEFSLKHDLLQNATSISLLKS